MSWKQTRLEVTARATVVALLCAYIAGALDIALNRGAPSVTPFRWLAMWALVGVSAVAAIRLLAALKVRSIGMRALVVSSLLAIPFLVVLVGEPTILTTPGRGARGLLMLATVLISVLAVSIDQSQARTLE